MAPTTSSSALRAMAALVLVGEVTGSSMYVAKMCRGQLCSDALYPILDYDETEEKCICRQPPCWNEDGNTHHCSTPEFPFLRFRYDEKGTVTCECSATPFYSSVYISKDLCPGQDCQDENYPVLDYDEEANKCICRAHPCTEVNGERHSCPDMRFPILRYREDEPDTPGGEPKPVCECISRLDLTHREEL